MYNGFPLLQISIIIALIFILWVSWRGIKLLEIEDYDLFFWILVNGSWVSGIGVFLAGALVGAPVEPRVVGSGMLGELMNLFYAPGLWLFHVVLVLLVTINLPAFIAGMVHLSLPHPAAGTVKFWVRSRLRPKNLKPYGLNCHHLKDGCGKFSFIRMRGNLPILPPLRKRQRRHIGKIPNSDNQCMTWSERAGGASDKEVEHAARR
jgi:hypothetical protein